MDTKTYVTNITPSVKVTLSDEYSDEVTDSDRMEKQHTEHSKCKCSFIYRYKIKTKVKPHYHCS